MGVKNRILKALNRDCGYSKRCLVKVRMLKMSVKFGRDH
jgi:hypothetical protein